VSEERADAAFAAEISYYLDHHLEGSDPAALDELRDRCAQIVADTLELPGLTHAQARSAMLGSLSFQAYPEVPDVLRELRARGDALIVVSNWDCSLSGWLEGAGLRDLVDDVVSSAAVGAAKPDPAIFAAGLERAGARPGDAVHVGDSPDNDVAGARAAGIRPVLVSREGAPPDGVESIGTLADLPSLL
jgi:putative hydrolase of the HAD superfamily